LKPSPVTIIYNPRAGGGSSQGEPSWLSDARRLVAADTGSPPRVFASRDFAEAERFAGEAADAGAQLVIAAGGDGTVRAVAEGLIRKETPLGILPRGTINVLARELGIPLDDVPGALEVALRGETRALDMGKSGDRHFLLMASVGIDASAVENVNVELKSFVGGGAYVVAGLSALATFTPPVMTVWVGGAREPYWHGEAFAVVIANTRSYGGDFPIAPEAEWDDGQFDICIFGALDAPLPVQRAHFLRQVGAVTVNLHRSDPDIHYLRASRVVVESDPPVPVQIDGDALATTPLSVEVVARALTVRVPVRPEEAQGFTG